MSYNNKKKIELPKINHNRNYIGWMTYKQLPRLSTNLDDGEWPADVTVLPFSRS